MCRHAVQFRLQLFAGDAHTPETLQRQGLQNHIFGLAPDNFLGNGLRKGKFQRISARRGAVSPVHFLNGGLTGDAFSEADDRRGVCQREPAEEKKRE